METPSNLSSNGKLVASISTTCCKNQILLSGLVAQTYPRLPRSQPTTRISTHYLGLPKYLSIAQGYPDFFPLPRTLLVAWGCPKLFLLPRVAQNFYHVSFLNPIPRSLFQIKSLYLINTQLSYLTNYSGRK